MSMRTEDDSRKESLEPEVDTYNILESYMSDLVEAGR